MEKRYADIRELLQNHLLRDEEPETSALINNLRHVKPKGYFTKSEFLEMCKWKDKQQRRRSDWQAHTESEIIDASRQVFATNDEYMRVKIGRAHV